MRLETWWLFAAMTFFISATPGPNMLLVMRSGAAHGFARALATMAGCMTALLLLFGLSALGLGALLKAFPAVFNTLRLVGAAYLVWLGVRCWQSPVSPDGAAVASTSAASAAVASTAVVSAGPVPAGAARPAQAWPALYRQGVLVAASNPKAILFAAAFLPQFVRADQPQLPQFVILLLTFVAIEGSWYAVYAGFGMRLARVLQRPPVQRGFNRLTGALFVGFAALMALARDS